MDERKQKILDRIKKVMAMANDNGGNEAEKALAFEKMGEMLERHNISISEVESKENLDESIIQVTIDGVTKQCRRWEFSLSGSIARSFDCEVVGSDLRGDYGNWRINFIGHTQDIENVMYFYRYLTRYIGKLSQKQFSRENDRKSYAFGMVSTLDKRLYDLVKGRTKVQVETGTMALVVVKKAAVTKKLADLFPNRRSTGGIKIGNHDAYAKGNKDGENVPLSRAVNGGSQSAQLR